MTIVQQPENLSFCGNLKDFIITGVAEIDFSLQSGDTLLVAETCSAINNKIVISIRSVVEKLFTIDIPDCDVYLQESAVQKLKATIGSSTIFFTVINGGIGDVAEVSSVFLKTQFLTLQPQQKYTLSSQPEFLSYYAQEVCCVKLRAYFIDGTNEEKTISDFVSNNFYTLDLNFLKINSKFEKQVCYYDVWVESLLGSRLTYIQRYILTEKKDDSQVYLFENTLGGLDSVCFTGLFTEKLTTSANITTQKDISQDSDIDFSVIYEQNTGYISDFEYARWLRGFFLSSQRYHITDSFYKIYIEESENAYKLSDLNSYTFEFLYSRQTKYYSVIRNNENLPKLLEFPILDELFFLAPRLAEFPIAAIADDLMLPVQFSFENQWRRISIAAIVQAAISASIDAAQGSIDLTQYWKKTELVRDELYLKFLDQKINAGYADKSGDSVLWNGSKFDDYLNQSVRTTDEVDFKSVRTDLVISDDIASKTFTSGLLGVGHRLWNGILELNEIIVRKAIHVFEIIIQKTSSVNGSTLTTPGGGMRIIQADELPDGYKCFFNNDEGAVPNPYIVGDQILHQVFTGKGIGRYWRLVAEVGEDYFILSKTDCEAGSGIPAQNDEVIQFGCRTDRSRQSAILTTSYGSDAPYTAYYSGIDSYSLEGKEVVREGNLNGIVDADLGQLTGFGLYAQNVFLKGVFKLMSGKSVDQAIADSKSEAIQDAKIQAEAIAQAEAGLAQTQAKSYADGIVSEAEQNAINEAQKRLDALQIGGVNLVDDTDKIFSTSREYTGIDIPVSIFKDGETYTWSFDLKIEGNFPPPFTKIYHQSWGAVTQFGTNINATQDWVRYSVTFVWKKAVTENPSSTIQMSFYCNYGSGSFPRVRRPKLEIGNKATSWSPSLADQQAQVDSAKSAAQTAQNTANAAQTTANNAQSSANAANNLLSDIASDNKLTAQEKQSAKKEWDIIISEKANIIAQGTKYGVSTSNYTAKYNTLNTYITPLLASLTTTSDIVGATFRVKFKEYYDARTELLKLVSDAAKTLADTANTAAQTAQTKADSAQNTADNAQQSVMQVTEQVTSLIADNEGIKMSVNTVSEKVDTAKNEAISAAATDAQNKADAAKNTAILDANRGKLFLRGTGFNNNASRQLIINNDGVNRAVGGRGLSLTIIRRSDHVIIDNINYDTYGTQSGLLAEKLNSLDSSVIVALTSFDAVTGGSLGEDLKNAIIRCGGSGVSPVNRMPYALVGIPGIGKGNGMEVITGNGSNDPYAEISTQIINGIPSGMNGAASSLSDQAKQAAIDAANTASQAKINLLKTQELATLDGKIDTEERRAIADAQAKYDAAISEAQKKANAAKDAAIGAAATDATNKSNSAKNEAVNAAKTYTDGRTESMWKGWIDASALDENKYYPVVFSCPPRSRVTVRLEVALNSGTKPSWSTHTGGFSVRCVWSVNGSGWGTTTINRIIDDFAYSFATTCPAGSIGQMTSSSHEYIYVRGGGKYHFTIINSGTPFLVTDTYTNNSQTIYTKTSIDTPEITGATKAEVSAQLEVLTGEISAKVSQTIYDSEKQVINSSLSQLRLDYNSINLTVSNVNTRLNTIEQSGMVTQSNFVTIFSQKKDALGGDIIASINVAPESVKIKAKNISLEGLVTVNGYVQITAAGKLIAGDGEFSGKITATKGFIGGFTIDSNKLSVGNPSSQYGNSTLISPSKIILNNTSSYMGSVTSGTKVELGVTNDYGGKAPFYFFRKDTILNAFRPAMSIESDCGDKVSIALTTKGSIISDRAIIDTGWGEMDASLYTVINFWVSTNITVISHSYRYIYFPTKESVFSLMGETRRFAIRIVILSYMHNGANFIIGGSRNISKLFNFNGGVHGDLEMGKGDVAEFLLVWDGYTYYARLISLGR